MPIPCRLCSSVSVRFKRFAGKSHDYDALIRFTRASAARKQKPRVRLRHSGRSEDRIETGGKITEESGSTRGRVERKNLALLNSIEV